MIENQHRKVVIQRTSVVYGDGAMTSEKFTPTVVVTDEDGNRLKDQCVDHELADRVHEDMGINVEDHGIQVVDGPRAARTIAEAHQEVGA